MDRHKSQTLFEVLKGQTFLKKYTVLELIDNGKSAAVFKVEDSNNNYYALKVFDNDMIDKYGYEIQEKRIKKEIELAQHSITNLVKIIEGGKEEIDDNEYYFIIMEYIQGENLKNYIKTSEYDEKFVRKVADTLLLVSEKLLEQGIVHRDIKPENIMVSDSGEIVLMDLGVIKLIGTDSYSDELGKQFVGTLRYAPPEFLTRIEEDSEKGWKAVNLYQIGGVLHDLIMKKELFSDIAPYANLVIAIKEDAPELSNADYKYSTIQLARNMLTKDWRKRLELCTNENIEEALLKIEAPNINPLDTLIDDFFTSSDSTLKKNKELEDIKRSNEEKLKIKTELSGKIATLIDESVNDLIDKKIILKTTKPAIIPFPIHSNRNNFSIYNTKNITYQVKYKSHSKELYDKSYFISVEGEYALGFIKPINFLFRIQNDESSFAIISFTAIVWGNTNSNLKLIPDGIMQELINTAQKKTANSTQYQTNRIWEIETKDIFEGIISFDEQSKQALTLEILKLLKRVLEYYRPEVEKQIEYNRLRATGEATGSLTGARTIWHTELHT